MKQPQVQSTYKFSSWNPGYDDVQNKMAELKEQGWYNLRFERGSHSSGGRDPYDNGFTYSATITGFRNATPQDAKRFIKEAKKDIEQDAREIRAIENKIEKFIKEQTVVMKEYTKKIEMSNRLIGTMEMWLNEWDVKKTREKIVNRK